MLLLGGWVSREQRAGEDVCGGCSWRACRGGGQRGGDKEVWGCWEAEGR